MEVVETHHRRPRIARGKARRAGASPGKARYSMRIRRSRSLVAFWEGADVVLHNYLTNRRSRVSPGVVMMIHELTDYRRDVEVIEALGRPLVDSLLGQDVLVLEDSVLDRRESTLDSTWQWGVEARHFHYVTQAVRFDNRPKLEREILGPQSATRPDLYKDYGHSDVELPETFGSRSGEMWDALRSRRTRRSFSREPITLREFSTVLLWTWGKQQVATAPDLGEYLFKTSPSGGARHPVEVYPIVMRVDGVEPGAYHYSVERHSLERLGDVPAETRLVHLCGGQRWVADAAVIFFMTAVVTRSMWKYRNAHAYRVVLLDAGHVGQTFHLVCTTMG
ncbi:MAG: SagB/ThcOx family dehydrogenase, partial [Actinomycetota bacterium]|nr:SagB/ThcOx family dehydrogenase [Actinomycetota bacterium]